MKKILILISFLSVLTSEAQISPNFTQIHNAQAIDWIKGVKYLGVPFGRTPSLNGVLTPDSGALYYNTFDTSLYGYTGNAFRKISGGGSGLTYPNVSGRYLNGFGAFGILTDSVHAIGDARYSLLGHTHTFASLTSKPTTLSGYGITDAYPLVSNPAGYQTLSDGNGIVVSNGGVITYIASADLVHTTGLEVITGNKGFTGGIYIINGIDGYAGGGGGPMSYTLSNTVSPGDTTGILALYYNRFSGTIKPTILTANRTYTLPNASGTIALTSDLSTYALDASVVHKAGIETITGYKTITADLTINNTADLYLYDGSGIVLNTDITSASRPILYGRDNGIRFSPNGNISTHDIIFPSTGTYNYTFPAATGTIALTSDLASATNIYNSDGTLSADRNVSISNHQITFDGTTLGNAFRLDLKQSNYRNFLSTSPSLFRSTVVDSASNTASEINIDYPRAEIKYSNSTGVRSKIGMNSSDSMYFVQRSGNFTFDTLRLSNGSSSKKMMVWDSVNHIIYRQAIPSGGIGGMTNPMTTLNDLIVGGSGGTPTRLAVGGEGTSLTVSGGNVTWAAGTSWNGGYAVQTSGDENGVTMGDANNTRVIHTGGTASTTFPLLSGLTKTMHLINQGSGNWTLNRQGSDQFWYHGAAVNSVVLKPGQSLSVANISGYWQTYFDAYNPDYALVNANTTGSAGSVINALSISAELISGGASSYNGSAAKSIAIQSASVTNAMLAGSIDLTTKVTGLLPDGNISSAATWNAKQAALSGTGIVKSSSGTISYLTDNSSNWNTAYTERNQWDGGATGLTAATGRTSLGGTTIGQAVFTLANPSAITFPRYNADNTVTALSASAFRTAIGAGTGDGTVTAISVTTGNGVSGSSSGGTTPALSFTLGAITPSSVNSVVISGSSTPTLAVTGTSSISGANTGDQTNISGNAATATKATNLAGGNSTTLLGSLPYQSNTDVTTLLSPNTTSTKKFLSQTGTGTNGAVPAWGVLVSGDIPSNAANTSGSAATLTTPRGIYGNNFDGSAALTQIIASTYGGTGNGFTKFSGPTTSEKTFTLPNSNATLLYDGGALGTPSGGTLTNATGLPIATGVSGLATGAATFLTTPTSANFTALVTDEVALTTFPYAAVGDSGLVIRPATATGKFLRDDGTFQTVSGGSGDVTKVGTPANTEVAFWTGNGTLGRSGNLLYSGSDLINTGTIQTKAGNAFVAYDATNSNYGEFKMNASNDVEITNGTSDIFLKVSGNVQIQTFTSGTYNTKFQIANDGTATINTLASGLVKSTSGVLSAATSGTDYITPSVTTLSSLVSIGTITSGGLGTGAVLGGVTMTLGSDAAYDVYYRNGSGVLTRLGGGTDGYVLTTHSTTSAPTWTASAGGGTTINNNANNRIITGSGTANTLEGEANFTYDGTNVALVGGHIYLDNGKMIKIKDASGNLRDIFTLGGDNELYMNNEVGSMHLRLGGGFTEYASLTTSGFNIVGSLNTTGTRVVKGWFTDLESTNAIVGNITGTGNIAGGTLGAIPYQSAANTTAVLAATATANKVLLSGASAAPVWSTPTFPNASATSGKMIKSDGTNWVASTETYAAPGTTGNHMTSDGTNWTAVNERTNYTSFAVSGSDVTTTGQSMVDITGLVSGTLTASTTYEVEAMLYVTTSAVTTGTQYAITGGGTGTAATVFALQTGTTTTNAGSTFTQSATAVGGGTFLTTSGASGIIFIKGICTTRSTGTPTISIQHLKVTSGTSTVKIGSYMKIRLLN